MILSFVVLHHRHAMLACIIMLNKLRLKLRLIIVGRVKVALKSLPERGSSWLLANHGLEHISVISELETLLAHLHAQRDAKSLSRQSLFPFDQRRGSLVRMLICYFAHVRVTHLVGPEVRVVFL